MRALHPDPRPDLVVAMKIKDEGGTGVAALFLEHREKWTAEYRYNHACVEPGAITRKRKKECTAFPSSSHEGSICISPSSRVY